ncbi:hypothetical protein CYY_003637 [Polysphondylium violaceum]|uniref:Oxidoreductase n=1 Tax=Polysphondylium violaceum TaxID=133409 RepID=A0A8J4PWH3_9MYCE|nr:hypothetical protein CYY_003637 [Polysphondylium violaceum]
MSKNKRVVLITGCSSGIGKSLSRALHNRKDTIVYASARKVQSISDLEAEGLNIVQLDVVDLDSINKAVEFIIQKEGKIDILINNAGMSSYSPSVELSDQDAKRIMNTNFFGVVNTSNAVAKHMINKQSGLIVNIGSIVGTLTTPFAGMYCASKAAVHSWTDALRMELDPFNVKVVLVLPGAIKSEIANNAQSQLDSILANTIYKPIEEYLVMRSQSSQSNAVSSEIFSEYVVNQIMKPSPPISFAYGPLSTLFSFVKHLPKSITDFIFKRKFGLLRLKSIIKEKSQ